MPPRRWSAGHRGDHRQRSGSGGRAGRESRGSEVPAGRDPGRVRRRFKSSNRPRDQSNAAHPRTLAFEAETEHLLSMGATAVIMGEHEIAKAMLLDISPKPPETFVARAKRDIARQSVHWRRHCAHRRRCGRGRSPPCPCDEITPMTATGSKAGTAAVARTEVRLSASTCAAPQGASPRARPAIAGRAPANSASTERAALEQIERT